MIRFNNDYNRSAHPAVLRAIAQSGEESFDGYGLDVRCQRAAQLIKDQLNCPQAEVHFVVGGTQANVICIDHALRPWECVVCADTGHINAHETGAPEHLGHKNLTLPHTAGKISAAQVEQAAVLYEESDIPEHVVKPRMVYISQSSEFGTVYSLAELEELAAVCRAHGLLLFIDGARLGYALAAQGADFTLADIARVADVFTVGGTKCGALFGEAIVVTNPDLQPCFRNSIKQNGAMLAKGWALGVQFEALFEDGLYLRMMDEATAQALRIRDAFAAAGVQEFVASPTNQQFVILSDAQMEALGHEFVFSFDHALGPSRNVCRFCTSWATTAEEVDTLLAAIQKL